MKKALAVAVVLVGMLTVSLATKSSEGSGATSIGPTIVAKIRRPKQTDQIPTTTIFTPTADGMFRISVYTTMVVPGSGYSVIVYWTDNAGPEIANVGGTTSGSYGTGSYCVSAAGPPPCGTIIFAKGGTPVSYSTSGDSNGGGTYDLYVVVERLE